MKALTLQENRSPEDFAEFLARLKAELGLKREPSFTSKGLREFLHLQGEPAVAIDEEERFLAAKWHETSHGNHLVHEAYFVCPKNMPAKAGYRVRLITGAKSTPQLELTPSKFWAYSKEASQDTQFPGFLELAGLLSASSSATTANPELMRQSALLQEDADYLQTLLEQVTQELRRTKAKVHALTTQTAERSDTRQQPAPAEPPFQDLANLQTWAGENVDRIVVLPRALNGAKKSRYERPDLVCTALELLAGAYREYRTGNLSQENLDALFAPLGFKIEGSVAPNVAGELGDTYFVRWGGKRRFLDLHLLKGGGRDERYCMRIYFFWDADTSRVVVGYLPAHLDNSLS